MLVLKCHKMNKTSLKSKIWTAPQCIFRVSVSKKLNKIITKIYSKLGAFLLPTSKIIYRWDKQYNLISNRKQDHFADPIGRLFRFLQTKTLFIFFWKQGNHFYLSRNSSLFKNIFRFWLETRQKNLSRKSIFCSVCTLNKYTSKYTLK